MRRLLGLALLSMAIIFGSGCATSEQFKYDYVPSEVKPAFVITDKRPAHEKQAKILSLSILSKDYGKYRLGDEQVVPNRMKYLQDQLQVQAGQVLSSKQVVVESFSIHNNIQKALKRSALKSALLGPVAAVSGSSGDAVVTAQLHISIDSKMVSAIAESNYVADIHSPDYKEKLPQNIKNAMDLAIAEVVSKLNNAVQLSGIDY